MNHLADALSPYLAAYADDPIDWYPWGEEAFAEARRRDVPMMISIGYSTCHWCHVMARESFRDAAIGALVDARFVAVKVDREEHPDVDAHYLAAAGAFTGSLGWPLTVFATPAGETFWAGTYFPPTARGGLPSFHEVLDAVTDAWTARRDQVEGTASDLAAALRGVAVSAETQEAETSAADDVVASAVAVLAAHEDREHGGFGGAPKFPVAPVLRFLLRAARRHPDAAGPALRTLDRLAASPLRDPVDGGFFRYGTRPDWSEPHYERMLYDNAGLLGAVIDAARLLRSRRSPLPSALVDAAEGIVAFLRDVLRTPGGGFAAAQDSESILDGERSEGGYFALDAASRATQEAPAVDRKVLTGWNGLAIGALADASVAFDDAEILALAVDAAEAVATRPIVRGRVDGQALLAPPTLEDVGLLAYGLVRLALAGGDARWAVRARELVDGAVDEEGRLRRPASDPLIPAAGPPGSEGALPSGEAGLAHAALVLHALTGEHRYRLLAERAVSSLLPLAAGSPIAFGGVLGVVTALAEPDAELVVLDERDGVLALAAIDADVAVTAIVTEEQARAFEDAGFALFAGRRRTDGRPTAYACRGGVCRAPITDPDDLRAALSAIARAGDA